MAGPIGHIENSVISLWFVTRAVAPLLAARPPASPYIDDPGASARGPGHRRESWRAEPLDLLSEGVPLAAAALAAGLLIWAHPQHARFE